MKNILQVFLFLIFQSFTLNLVAESCAIESDKIKEYSYEICQEDESFRILYEMFPRLFEEGLFIFGDFGDIEKLKENPEIALDNQYKKFSSLMYELFKSMTTLITYLITFFLFYSAFFSLLKASEEGSFVDYNKESLLKMAAYSGVTVFLLLPVGELITAQIIILFLAVISISLANYIYGYYLSTLQGNVQYIETQEDGSSNFLIQDHSDAGAAIAAKSYVSQLSKIALCRDTTSQYIMNQESFSLNTSNLEERRNCSAGIDDFSIINEYIEEEDKEYPSFFNIGYDDIKQMSENILSQNKNMKFGISENRNCSNDVIYHYDCGEIVAKVPKINDNYLLNIYGLENFLDRITSIASSLSLNGNNQSNIENGWKDLKEELILKVNIYALKDKDNIASGELQKIKFAEEIYYKRNLIELKKASYIYHQMILNSLTTGLSFVSYDGVPWYDFWNDSFTKEYNNFKAFESDWSKVEKLAKKIQKNYCQLNSQGLNNSYKLTKKLTSLSFGSGTSTRCVDFDTLTTYGVDEEGKPLDKFKAIELSENLLKEIQTEFEEISDDIFKRRIEVEMSFIASLNDMQDSNLLNDIRKRGWLTMPTYIMEFSKDIKINNTYLKSLIGSNGFKPLKIENNMVANNIMAIPGIYNNSFTSYTEQSNVFKGFIDQRKENDIYNNNATFTRTLLQDNQEVLLRGGFDFGNLLESSLLDPITPLKAAIGLEMIEDLGDLESNMKIIDQCQDDIDSCPIPKKDPIVELNRYGHYLISSSLHYFSVVIAVKGLASFRKGVRNHKLKTAEKKGANAGVKEVGNKFMDKIKGNKIVGGVLGTLNATGYALDIVSDILSAVGFLVVMMFFAGMFLAYILPLIPVMYFVVGFIGWLLIVIQTLMIVPIWAIYFIKYKDNKDIIHSAGKTYGIQIILKPSLMVIGLLFAWELIKVALFFINITIFPLLSSMSSDSFLLSYMQNVMFLMLFIFIISVMINFVLNVMQTLSDQLLAMFNVEAAGDSGQQFSSIMQYYMLHAGMNVRDKITDGTLEVVDTISHKSVKALTLRGENIRLESDIYTGKEQGDRRGFLEKLKYIASDEGDLDDRSFIRSVDSDKIEEQVIEDMATDAKAKNQIQKNVNEMNEEKEKETEKGKKDILDNIAGDNKLVYDDGNGNRIESKDPNKTIEDLKQELEDNLKEEKDYYKNINIGEKNVDVKFKINGSSDTNYSFDIQYKNSEVIKVIYNDGNGNIIQSKDGDITEEELKQILEEELENIGENGGNHE